MLAIVLVLAGAVSGLKFLAEPSFDYYGGRGQCVKYRVPGHSLVTGYFRINPQQDIKSNVVVQPRESLCGLMSW